MQIYYRWASSLGGGFAGTPEEVWGVEKYDPEKHINEPVVFCGVYGFPDFYALWRHKGKKYIWWCGSDILHFKNGYFLEDSEYGAKLDPTGLAQWITRNCESWVENELEKETLHEAGVYVTGVSPSFLGNKEDYQICFKPGDDVYVSCGKGKQELYGFDIVERIAKSLPWLNFHLYGDDWRTECMNVVVHGRVSQEQMNEEIKKMQIGLRLNGFDGFSEVCAKAVLWGQYTISKVKHPHIPSFDNDMDLIVTLNKLAKKEEPNFIARNYYWQNLNKYPWVNV